MVEATEATSMTKISMISILFFCFENVEKNTERLRDRRREIWTEIIHDQVFESMKLRFYYLFKFSEKIRPDLTGLDYKTKTTVDQMKNC